MDRRIALLVAVTSTLGVASAGMAQSHQHEMHKHEAQAAGGADDRPLVRFPEPMRIHMLANMRDHLLGLQEIQEALARQQYDRAADTAEQRLGMSSLKLHGAHEVSGFMPEAMQAIGTGMHQAASRLAIAARDAAATGDVKLVLEAMARVTAQCVACHASYRAQ
jgi:hypothetical protein